MRNGVWSLCPIPRSASIVLEAVLDDLAVQRSAADFQDPRRLLLVPPGCIEGAHDMRPFRLAECRQPGRCVGSQAGVRVEEFKGVRWEFLPWRNETEVQDLNRIDIGVMPLDKDDGWSPGKCGLKALLYMAIGLPAVCSPVGVNSEIFRDGVNGFLAEDQEEWIQKLSLLLENTALRSRLGLSGRQTVEDSYSIKKNVPILIGVLNKILNEPR